MQEECLLQVTSWPFSQLGGRLAVHRVFGVLSCLVEEWVNGEVIGLVYLNVRINEWMGE